MINPITYISNLIKLLCVQRTLNKYRPTHSPRVKLMFKPLLKRSVMNVVRIKLNRTTIGLLVASQKNETNRITYVDYVWVNAKKCHRIDKETESSYYQTMYALFMQWHQDLVIRPWARFLMREDYPRTTACEIAISLNVTKEAQIERFRRILTLYDFKPNLELTLKDIDFVKPYREKEQITNVIYSRYI